MPTLELPGQLRLTPTFPFVGRSRELAALRMLVPGAGGDGRRVALVGGEAGSGKSRLVRELAIEAVRSGALVLYGACDSVVRSPYRPFVEALEQLARVTDPDDLRRDLGAAPGEFLRLLPRLPSLVGDLPAPVSADPDTERHRLHIAVADLLSAVSRRQPLVLVVEDGHWADPPTLLLLRHLARTAVDARMLLIATFRDADADVPEELANALSDLRRSEDVVRLRLRGLTSEEIVAFVRAAGAAEGPELPERPELVEVARAIAGLTDGNAFLITELWRTLIETGALERSGSSIRLTRPLGELGTPEGVREVVSQRVTRLAPSTTELLELAAVVGPVFEARVLEHATTLEKAELVDALDEAVRSGMVEEVSELALVYRFTHELVRRALSDRLTAARRADLHLRVGRALEVAYERELDRVLPDLAHHFAASAAIGDLERAVEYNVLAGRAAAAALAFEEASARLQAAIDLGIDDPGKRVDALLELGDARHRAGKSLDALEAYRAAAGIARALNDPVSFARAAIGYENACWRPGIVDQGALELLEEAVAALGEGDSPLRVLVLAGLSRAHVDRGDHVRGSLVQEGAITMARRLEDREGLARVLLLGHRARGSKTDEELLAQLTESRDLGEQLGKSEIVAESIGWRVPCFISLGDLRSARREVRELLELVDRLAEPFGFHIAEQYLSAIALAEGTLEEAEAAAERSHDWSLSMTGRDASGVHGVQMFSVRREQGRLSELAPMLRAVAAADPARSGAWSPGLAATLSELGMERDVQRELDRIVAAGLEPLRESLWLASLTYLADACAAVRDEAVAELVFPELRAYAGEIIMIGYGVACYGAADRYLGMLAGVAGEWDTACDHFEAALERNRAMGADTWLAHTGYEYGRVLLARGGPASRRAAVPLLAESGELARRIGMPTLIARIRALGVHHAEPAPRRDGLSPREEQILRLVARGLSNREVGRELVISEHTAANHVRAILRKTGCGNRTEAAAYAHRQGLV